MLSLWHTLSRRAKKKEEKKEDNQAVNDVFFSLRGAISKGKEGKAFSIASSQFTQMIWRFVAVL